MKFFSKKKRKNLIVSVVDIGSSKIACLIAYVRPNGKVKVIGVGHSESSGFKAGMITDRKLAEQSIITAIDIAERMCGENIDKIIVTISASGVKSNKINCKLELSGHIVTERDVDNLLKYTLNKFDTDRHEVIHYFPLEFFIDQGPSIKNPLGLFGHDLTAHLHLVTLPVSIVYNIVNCLADCHLDVEEVVSSVYIAGYSSLTKDEKELGTILIDLGGATTSYAVFSKSTLIHSGLIPLGGMNITSDISKILSISMKNAERIKTLYGSAIITFADNYKMIDLPLIGDEYESRETYSISNANLNSIIAARLEEIFNLIKVSINKSSIDKFSTERIVLTGGGSLMPGIQELSTSFFKTKIRISKPKTFEGLNIGDDLTSFASPIGVLECISEKYEENNNNSNQDSSCSEKKQSMYSYISDWIKENF